MTDWNVVCSGLKYNMLTDERNKLANVQDSYMHSAHERETFRVILNTFIAKFNAQRTLDANSACRCMNCKDLNSWYHVFAMSNDLMWERYWESMFGG
jgi:hypothetical protein